MEIYYDDFNKYAKDTMRPRLHLVLEYAVCHVGEKIKYTNVSRDYESKEIKRATDLLLQSKVITKIQNTRSQGVPLSKGKDVASYKLLFFF